MKPLIFLLTVGLFVNVAHAAHLGPAGGAVSGLKDGSSLAGLCSGDAQNMSAKWEKQGWCRDIDDALNGPAPNCKVGNGKSLQSSNGGSQSMADLLRNEVLNSKSPDMLGFAEACPANRLKEIAGDQTKWELFLKQIIAVLTIQESEWSSHSTSYMGAQGLMQLDRKSVSGYNKCSAACASLSKSGRVIGDNDNNMKCGTTIACYWMISDQTMGTGSGNKRSRGAARYFQPFRNIDRANRRWMMAKTKNYCENRIDQDSASASGGSSTAK